uniref:Uncharacterized protein n=1 Tax=Mola mola TaxID=94237 RepID=A0A3Q3WHF2_MOLML
LNMSSSNQLIFFINGKKVVDKNADPEEVLLGFLRRKVGLTGTKYGCGSGGCGACTVMVSRYDRNQSKVVHFAANACLLPVVTLHGAAVVTVEGVGSTKAKLHPVQERIAKAHGSQCGFCTPGMVMSMYALLRNKPQPTMEDIREALGGNLCRCTGYRPIIDGFKTFCESEVGSFLLPGIHMQIFFPLLKAEHPSAPLIVGNTTIGPKMLLKGVHHPLVIYAGRVAELGAVTWGKNGVTVGAACSLSTLQKEMEEALVEAEEEKSRGYRALLQTLQCLAGKQIRNMATVGGNLLSANPKYDLSSVLAVLDCTLHIASKDGMKSIPFDEKLFTGFGETALRPDEVLLSINIPYTKPWEFVAAHRQAQRREFAFSFVNAGMKVVMKEGSDIVESLNIYYGGVGSTLVKPRQTCQQLVGRSWGEDLFSDACRILKEEVDVSPSIHGGRAEYRKTLCISFFFKFYMQVLQEIKGRTSIFPRSISALSSLSRTKCHRVDNPSRLLVSEAQTSNDTVGRPSMHQSAFQQATGEARYYDDLPPVQGELFIFMVTSTRAHAKILNIDPSEALNMPGVVTFLSAGDVPGANRRLWFNNPEELFAEEEVLCVGQIIGAVVAEGREQARRAAQKVQVTYQDLQPVFFTIEDAIKHESYFEPKRKVERGEVDEALKDAEHILEDEIYMGGQEHFYIETQGMIAVPKGENDEMDLFMATQHAAFNQELVGMALGVDSNRITCHVKRLGGSFGGKVMKTAVLSAITAVAAHKTGRPVRCCLERGDDMLITGGRHPFLGKYKVGYNSDGTIVAADITYYSNAGCTLDESMFIMEKAILHMDNGYKIPNLRGHGIVCKTYLPSYTAFRGFGGPQGLMVMENILHEVAVRCSLPPEKVREINMYREELCYTHHKQPFCPTNMVRCWGECLEQANYQDRHRAVQLFNSSNRWKKRGIAAIPLKFGIGFSKGFYNQGAALVNIYKDGSVLVSHSGTDMGQGINTKAIQIASRALNVPMSNIFIKDTCTGNVPNAAPSAASFGTDAVGMAIKDACEKLMKRLQPLMEKNPQNTWKQWVNDAFFEKISLSATGFYTGPPTDVDWEKGEGQAYYYFTFGACCSEVEIDCLTGDHKNIRTDIVMDIGKSINPALDIGQVEGGFVQGLGLYTIEELQFSPDGVLMTRGPSQYKVPALCDIPAELNGIGEPPIFFGSTIFFAIKVAIAAARKERGLGDTFPLSSPATAEKIRMACQDDFTDMASSPTDKTATPWCIDV